MCFLHVPCCQVVFKWRGAVLSHSVGKKGILADKPLGMLEEQSLEEFVNHSPAARDLRILLVFYQHPTWFISLYYTYKS